MQDVSRGAQRVRRWPRKRPGKGSPKERAVREKFRQAQRAAHYLAPNCKLYIDKQVEGSPLLPRDIVTMMVFGRWAAFVMPDGKEIWPMAARIDVSEALDILGAEEGATLVRGPKYWEAFKGAASGGSGRGVRLDFPNLLLEDGTAAGWTLSGFSLATSGYGVSPWIGTHLLVADSGGVPRSCSHVLDLQTQFTDEQLDGLPVLTLVTLAGSGFDDADNLLTKVTPLDSSGSAIRDPIECQNYTDSPTNDKWSPSTLICPLPIGTRQLDLEFRGIRKAGTSVNVLLQGVMGWLDVS